ncbi:MAG: hypothetical protein ACYTF7_12215 [Planctomycetota bacterium]
MHRGVIGQQFAIWDGSYDEESGDFEALFAEEGNVDGVSMTASFDDDGFEGEVAMPDGVVMIVGSKG